MASLKSKITKGIKSYVKNVAGGAKIVGSAIAGGAKKAGSLSANVIQAVVPNPPARTPTTPTTKPPVTGVVSIPGRVPGEQGFEILRGGAKPSPQPTAIAPGDLGGSSSPAQSRNLRTSKSGASTQLTTSSTPLDLSSAFDMGGLISDSGSSPSFSSPSSGSTNSLSSNASSVPSSSVVNTNTLTANNTKLTFPEPDIPDYSKYIPPVITPAEKSVEDATKNREDTLAKYLKELTKAPDSEDAYKKAQKETDILNKQKTVNDLTGQLNAIVNKGQAQQLSLVGQGRGIPEAIIGGQQAQIGRETAIAALPIQAQLEAAQGNLEMANDNLDTLFKIYSEDAKNEYEYRKEVKKMVYEFATEKEKRALEKLDKQEDRAYQELRDLHTEQNAYAKMAFETGQSALGAKIAKLDYKSPTFKAELANLSSKIVDQKRNLEILELQNKLANAGSTISPKVLATTQFKAAQAAQNLKLTLEKAKAAVEKYGNYENASGVGKGILNSLKVQLRSEISTALEQGVVVPGEAESFDKIAGQLNSSFLGIPNVRNSVTLAGLDSLSKSMDGRIALQKAALTNTYKVTPEQVDTLLNITNLSDQEYADMEALTDE